MYFLTVVLTYDFLKELNMPSKLLMSLLGLLFTASTVLAQTPGVHQHQQQALLRVQPPAVHQHQQQALLRVQPLAVHLNK